MHLTVVARRGRKGVCMCMCMWRHIHATITERLHVVKNCHKNANFRKCNNYIWRKQKVVVKSSTPIKYICKTVYPGMWRRAKETRMRKIQYGKINLVQITLVHSLYIYIYIVYVYVPVGMFSINIASAHLNINLRISEDASDRINHNGIILDV